CPLGAANSGLMRRSICVLFDDLVGLREQARRDDSPDCSRRRKTDDQFKLGRLYYGHVPRFLPFEDAAGVNTDLAISGSVVRAIADQTTHFNKSALKVHARK